MNLNDWFDKGMSFKDYVAAMNVNKEELANIYDQFSLSKEDEEFFMKWRAKGWRVIVLTADWCGDALLCVPIVKRISEIAGFEMSLLIRDENLELMDQYLTNGTSRAIPIFIFIDHDGNEKAVWGPRSPEVQDMIMTMRSELPDQSSPEFEAKQQEMYRSFREKLATDKTIWASVVRSVKERFKSVI
ncbi:thioredoxin family protein [Fictibacillus gelatini]|uniref:thioredoxin family protein n=1 Tax=Fictibacillus gelatini TaxID=225985 RepID=UPI0003F56620|nr:thioredoxin family protein [Fictibacillus gelatini]